MELVILDKAGKDTGRKITLTDEVFKIKPNDHAIYLDVKQFQANQRQGTHKSKERAEVAGSTRKLHKQKGTGGSRKGSIKNPLYRHGGRVFGPRPRDYSFKLNKKVKELARKSALSYKASESKITVLEDFTFDKPRTKDYLNFLSGLSLSGRKTLFVVTEKEPSALLTEPPLLPVKWMVTFDKGCMAVSVIFPEII